MSNPIQPAAHPDPELLLGHLDGELARGQAREVRAHLEACWECRAQVEDLERTIGVCVRYRSHLRQELLPPDAWQKLDFERVEAELAAESWISRVAGWVSPRQSAPVRWALSAAAALALAILLVHQLRETPKVEAAVLLKRAVAVSQSRPSAPHRVRFTTRNRQITRVIGGARSAVAAKPSADEAEISALFAAAHYPWDDPLSAQSYSIWRGTLPHYRDALSSQADAYEITTTTADSELVSAKLTLRGTDLEPVSGRFEFRDRDWVEMTELVDQPAPPASAVAGTTGGMPHSPGMPPASIAASTVDQASPISEELQVFAALHRMGADLGDPLAVTREGRDVLVTGTGIAPQRQEQIHAQLDRLPHVAVRFQEPVVPGTGTGTGTPANDFPASKEPGPSEPVARDAAAPEKPIFPARIEERLGGRPQFERFSGQVLDWSDSAMTRAYALRRLAQQFPPASEAAMSPEDRSTLHNLAREHLSALSRDSARIANTVGPVLSGLGANAAAQQAVADPANWQAATEDLLASAHRVESRLAQILGVTSGEGASADSPAQLAAAMAQLSARVERTQRVLADQ